MKPAGLLLPFALLSLSVGIPRPLGAAELRPTLQIINGSSQPFDMYMMLAKRPEVCEAMIKSGARLCIMARNEFTTDLPEFVRLSGEKAPGFDAVSAKDYWDARARGLGGSETDPYCSVGEENLLG